MERRGAMEMGERVIRDANCMKCFYRNFEVRPSSLNASGIDFICYYWVQSTKSFTETHHIKMDMTF